MRASILVLCCLVCQSVLYCQVPRSNLQITYVANAGFLLTSSTHKVLIDALFSEGPVAPKEVTGSIMDAKPPFDNINLYLLTHYHKDHCDPELLQGYLSKHRSVSLVTSKPAIAFIHGNCYEFILLKKQFVELTPEVNQSVSSTVDNIPVKAFGLSHASYYREGIDMNEDMLNLSFLLEMDGIRVFHSGDIKINAFQEYVSRNSRWTDSIDVALLCYGLFESGVSDLDYIMATIHPKNIVVMHVPRDQKEESAAKIEQLRARSPNIVWLKSSMDSTTISIAGMKPGR